MELRAPSELDPASETEFDALLAQADPADETLVDFAGVQFCDSTGLRVLVAHHRRHVDAGGSLQVVNVPPSVRRVFEITGLEHLLAPPG